MLTFLMFASIFGGATFLLLKNNRKHFPPY